VVRVGGNTFNVFNQTSIRASVLDPTRVTCW